MTIDFKARVLLELGAELISSDAVALYELIKNGLDAGSKKIAIEVQIAMQPSTYRRLRRKHMHAPDDVWDAKNFHDEIVTAIEESADEHIRQAFVDSLGRPRTKTSALQSLGDAIFKHNFVAVVDRGTGMTVEALQKCYLTIGTPTRYHERESRAKLGGRPPLGEKGIGRLAAMRLGHHVHVRTGTVGAKRWNELNLDWRPVFDDPDLDASELDFRPVVGREEKPDRESGTRILIRDLQSDWTVGKLKSLADTDLMKLVDPFANNFANQFLSVSYQNKKQKHIIAFDSNLLQYADATCEIEFRSGPIDGEGGARLQVTTSYAKFEASEVTTYTGSHLMSILEDSGRKQTRRPNPPPIANSEHVDALSTLGNFSAKFHWFNRGRLSNEDNIFWMSTLRDFVQNWSGGLLVYRDGYRVYPYGSASDDWLDLDRKALAASAYKLNRAQIVGYLRIGVLQNPSLQDQTNREGFRHCPEREVLRRMLRHSIVSDCKTFLTRVEDKNKGKADEQTIEDLEDRISSNQRSAVENLQRLRVRVPTETETVNAVLAELQEVEDAWEKAKEALKAHKSEIEHYVHLAGIGLMVELIAHELARSTDSALSLLNSDSIATSPKQLEVLEAQLKTLNKRVRVLDHLSVPGRHRHTVQDLGAIVETVIEVYEAKAKRHGIEMSIKRIGKGGLRRKVEKGQIIQIVDNLMSNSVYWLQRRLEHDAKATVTIEIDATDSLIRFTDSGPGIPHSTGDRVFDPFYTTKPSGDGRGLGLYIARRLAVENGAELTLLPAAKSKHTGFVLRFAEESNS